VKSSWKKAQKERKKKKSPLILRFSQIIFVSLMALTVIGAGEKREQTPGDLPYGEWEVRKHNREGDSPPAVVYCKLDGSVSVYGGSEGEAEQGRALFSVVNSWVDDDGTVYMEVICSWEEGHQTYELWKYRNGGRVWEKSLGIGGFPSGINPYDPTYLRLRRRQ
jgi:hypothetical protein